MRAYGALWAAFIGLCVFYALPEDWRFMLGLLMLALLCAAGFGLMLGALVEELVAWIREDDER